MNEYGRIAGVATLLALVPAFVGGSSYLMRVAVLALLFTLLGIALNLVFGHTDQLFLFLGGLTGIGAYSTALSASMLDLSAWVTMPLGMAICGLIAGLVSYVAARRRFSVVLISILTLNLQLAFVAFFVGARSITHGSTGFAFDGLGLTTTGAALTAAFGLDEKVILYMILVVLVGLSLAGYVWIIDSRYGLAFGAIREDELAAESVGLNVVRYKTIAGVLAGALIGVTGVMYVALSNYVSPALFGFHHVDVLVLIMLIVGGLRTTYGPLVGAWIIVVIKEALSVTTEYQTAVFGAMLIALFLYFRSGIVPAVGRIWRHRARVLIEARETIDDEQREQTGG